MCPGTAIPQRPSHQEAFPSCLGSSVGHPAQTDKGCTGKSCPGKILQVLCREEPLFLLPQSWALLSLFPHFSVLGSPLIVPAAQSWLLLLAGWVLG